MTCSLCRDGPRIKLKAETVARLEEYRAALSIACLCGVIDILLDAYIASLPKMWVASRRDRPAHRVALFANGEDMFPPATLCGQPINERWIALLDKDAGRVCKKCLEARDALVRPQAI